MHLSQESKSFSQYFIQFLNLHKFLNFSKKRLELFSLSIFEIIHSEKRGYLKCIAGFVSEHPSVVNVFTCPKHSWSLQENNFILLFHHFDIDRAEKRPS